MRDEVSYAMGLVMGPACVCGDCRHLERTSTGQVFLRCGYWCGESCDQSLGYDYVIAHCHVQPSAPACTHYVEREEPKLLAALRRELDAGVPYSVAVPALLGGVVS